MSDCKCVLSDPAVMPEVLEWLCEPPNGGSAANKCAHMADLAKQANTALAQLQQHKQEGPDRVTTPEGAADNFTKLTQVLAHDFNVLGDFEDKFDKLSIALSGIPASMADDADIGNLMTFAKSRADERSAGTGSEYLAGEFQWVPTGQHHPTWPGSGHSLDGPQRQALFASAQSVRNSALSMDEALTQLEDYQREYQALSKHVSDQHADRLAELQAKARACSDGDAAKCPGGQLSDEERAELARLINAKGAGISGAGRVGIVGAAIASSQEPTKRTFKEQCLLLSNIVHFVEYRDTYLYGTPKGKKRKPYRDFVGTSGSINANACLMADREPWGFMNQLVQDPSFNTLFNIETKYLSHLQPMIRLYKIVTDSSEDGTKEFEQEVTFEAAYNENFDGVLKSSVFFQAGVGIRDFTFSYEGSDPFAVKKSIKARLSIFASSFDDLLKPRDGYRYADLALKTGTDTKFAANVFGNCNDEIVGSDLSKFNFRLKAVVGWAMPNSVPGISDRERGELTRAINNSFVTLNLTPTIHEFEIGEDGRVLFNIDYLAYVDQFFDEAAFNIFSDPDISANIFRRRLTMETLNKGCTEKSEEEMKTMQEDMAEELDNDKRSQLASIISQLLNMKKVYFKSIPYESLRKFNSQGPYWKFDLFSDTAGDDGGIKDTDASTEEAEKTKAEAEKSFSQNKDETKSGPDLTETKVSDVNLKEYIAFFYLSDLVDIILQNIDRTLDNGVSGYGGKPDGVEPASRWNKAKDAEAYRLKRLRNNFKQFRVLLGPIELVDVKTREYYTANIGDLPISTAYFMDWLTDKTLKRDNVIYSLPLFLKDLVNNLIREFLNEDKCFDINMKQRVRMFQSTVTSFNKDDGDEITGLIEKQAGKAPYDNAGKLNMRGLKRKPVLNVMGERDMPINSRPFENTFNYAVFYAGRTQPQKKMMGLAGPDTDVGIFHYILGKDRGLVKNIQLTKTDSPGLKEVRFEQEGYDGLMQLREVYDATITCYGMPNAVPGTYIYIEPRSFAPNAHTLNINFGDGDAPASALALTKLGIGGYYMITHAETSLAAGQCETVIKAKWVAQLGCGKSMEKEDAPGRRSATSKCST